MLQLDDEVYMQWNTFNATERYGILLEAWVLRGKVEILGERGRWGMIPDNFEYVASFYSRIPMSGLKIAGNRSAEEGLPYFPGLHSLGLMELFGFIAIQRGKVIAGKGWQIEQIDRTLLGDAMLALLAEGFFEDFDKLYAVEDEGTIPIGLLQNILQPYFPAWQKNLTPPQQSFRAGTYTFKVSLGPIWRRIAIGSGSMLDDLALAILDSVAFDNDHLYEFSMKTRLGYVQRISHPYGEEPPLTNEVRLGDLQLPVGHSMTFLFDYGDNWEFDVLLEQIDQSKTIKKVKFLESHGEAPEQYPNWDDEAWDGEIFLIEFVEDEEDETEGEEEEE